MPRETSTGYPTSENSHEVNTVRREAAEQRGTEPQEIDQESIRRMEQERAMEDQHDKERVQSIVQQKERIDKELQQIEAHMDSVVRNFRRNIESFNYDMEQHANALKILEDALQKLGFFKRSVSFSITLEGEEKYVQDAGKRYIEDRIQEIKEKQAYSMEGMKKQLESLREITAAPRTELYNGDNNWGTRVDSSIGRLEADVAQKMKGHEKEEKVPEGYADDASMQRYIANQNRRRLNRLRMADTSEILQKKAQVDIKQADIHDKADQALRELSEMDEENVGITNSF